MLALYGCCCCNFFFFFVATGFIKFSRKIDYLFIKENRLIFFLLSVWFHSIFRFTWTEFLSFSYENSLRFYSIWLWLCEKIRLKIRLIMMMVGKGKARYTCKLPVSHLFFQEKKVIVSITSNFLTRYVHLAWQKPVVESLCLSCPCLWYFF